jgi:hypothetical protein
MNVCVCVCVCVFVCVYVCVQEGVYVVEAHKYDHMWHWEPWKVLVLPIITVLSILKEDIEATGKWRSKLE